MAGYAGAVSDRTSRGAEQAVSVRVFDRTKACHGVDTTLPSAVGVADDDDDDDDDADDDDEDDDNDDNTNNSGHYVSIAQSQRHCENIVLYKSNRNVYIKTSK